MPYIETLHELAEEIADLVGVYGAHEENEVKRCRVCFTSGLVERIRCASKNEKRLSQEEAINQSWREEIGGE